MLTDITYMTRKEIEANKSIFCTCPTCHQEGIRISEIIEYRGTAMCGQCYIEAKQDEIGVRELKLEHGWVPGTWQCSEKDWDLGSISGYGNTRDEAIADYLDSMACRHDLEAKHIEYYFTK